MGDESALVGIGVGPNGSTEYYQEGAIVDFDNHPSEAEGYQARRFADPEWTPLNGPRSSLSGEVLATGSDATDAVIDRIDAGLPAIEPEFGDYAIE